MCMHAPLPPGSHPRNCLVAERSSSVVLRRGAVGSLLAVAVCHLLLQNAKGMPQQDMSVG